MESGRQGSVCKRLPKLITNFDDLEDECRWLGSRTIRRKLRIRHGHVARWKIPADAASLRRETGDLRTQCFRQEVHRTRPGCDHLFPSLQPRWEIRYLYNFLTRRGDLVSASLAQWQGDRAGTSGLETPIRIFSKLWRQRLRRCPRSFKNRLHPPRRPV